MSVCEVYQSVTMEDEIDNTIGRLLCLPSFFSSFTMEVDASFYAGYAGNYFNPQEYPEVSVNELVITSIDDDVTGRQWKINKVQSALIEKLINDEKLEDSLWECHNDNVRYYEDD